jgi:hypothetical protein
MPNKKNNKQANSSRKRDKDREMSPKGNMSKGRMKPDTEGEVSKPYDEDVAAEMTIRGRKNTKK